MKEELILASLHEAEPPSIRIEVRHLPDRQGHQGEGEGREEQYFQELPLT